MLRVTAACPTFSEPSIDAILSEIKTTLKSHILTNGPQVQRFENEFADYVGVKHAVAVSSGTAALEILLRFFGVKDKEVIVPTNTFVATPTSVLLSGGKVVFADIKADTLCIDPLDLERKITSKTKGVIVVHIAGLICPEIAEIKKICHDHNLFLIEDAAHAHGAKIDDQMAGSLCDGAAFSFYPTKIMTTGQGGMVTTNDSAMASTVYSMRDHGLTPDRIMTMIGDNWCMSEVTAILGRHQLVELDASVHRRREIAKHYDSLLSGIPSVSLFKPPSNFKHSYYKYPILVEDVERNELMLVLKKQYGIETGGLYYPPCHLHQWFKENLGTKEGDLPVSEKVLKQVLCLPMHLGVTKDIAQYVVNSLKASLKSYCENS
jgi:dTDP-4-amino-4,6-dideoxygalactose transaminase